MMHQEARTDVSYQSPDRSRRPDDIDTFDPFGYANTVPSKEAVHYFGTPSTVSLSTSPGRRPHHYNNTKQQQQPITYRTNQPKQTRMKQQPHHFVPSYEPSTRSYLPPSPAAPPVTRRQAAWHDEDMPFDQCSNRLGGSLRRGVIAPLGGSSNREKPPSRPFDEEAPDDELQARELSENEERFNDSFQPAGQLAVDDDYEEFGLSPGSATDCSGRDEDSLFDFEEERRLADMERELKQRQEEEECLRLEEECRRLERAAEDERLKEDERRRKIRAAVAVRRRRRRTEMDDCDSSSMGSDHVTTLQDRTQAAFARKNRLLRQQQQQNEQRLLQRQQFPQSPPKGALKTATNRSPGKKIRTPGSPCVSFDEKPPSVHTFYTDDDSEHTDDDEDHDDFDDSPTRKNLDDRSLNSVYTKSLESEVEDVIKDLLFIGSGTASNPGRRAIKNQPAKKRELQDQAKQADDETLGTFGEEERTNYTHGTLSTLNGENVTMQESGAESTPNNSPRQQTRVDDGADDPLNVMWEFMEGGVATISSVFGIAPKAPRVCAPPKTDIKEDPRGTKAVMYVADDTVDTPQLVSPQPQRSAPGTREVNIITPDGKETYTEPLESPTSFEEALEFAADLILGPPEKSAVMSGQPEDEEELSTYKQDEFLREPDPHITTVMSLEGDPRLAELALHTARSVHEINGVVLDESADIELVTQLEFVVVKVGLPLGILFQENGGGCWVAKVFPDGNAASKSIGGDIKIGDQLAAVDGRSAINMKVDDICTLISGAENTQSIELTFMRYVGPMHPLGGGGGASEDGNEVSNSEDQAERRTDANTRGRRNAESDVERSGKRERMSLRRLRTSPDKAQWNKKQGKQLKEGKKRWFSRSKKPAAV